eukprot:IDg2470t1
MVSASTASGDNFVSQVADDSGAHTRSSWSSESCKAEFVCATVKSDKNLRSYIDCGATAHVFHDPCMFVAGSLVECDSDSEVHSTHIGEVMLPLEHADLRVTSVYMVPDLGFNLVSVGRMADNGIASAFSATHVTLTQASTGYEIGRGKRDSDTGLYMLPSPQMRSMSLAVPNVADAMLWHRRLAHVNMQDLRIAHKHADGMPAVADCAEVCRACRIGKAHKLRLKVTSSALQKFAKSCTRTYKSEVADAFVTFKSKLESMIGSDAGKMICAWAQRTPQTLLTLRGTCTALYSCTLIIAGEYRAIAGDARASGIKQSFSAPYTPEHNAIAERVNRTIVESARSMLIQANLPHCLWPFAIKNVVSVRNRLPHSAMKRTPHETITGSRPSLKHFRVFGCAAYVLQLPRKSKLEACAIEDSFPGFPDLEERTDDEYASDDTIDSLTNEVNSDDDDTESNSDFDACIAGSCEDSGHSPHVTPYQALVGDGDDDDAESDEDYENGGSDSSDDDGNEGGSFQDDACDGNDGTSVEEEIVASFGSLSTASDNAVSATPAQHVNRRYPSRTRKPPGAWWSMVAQTSNSFASRSPSQLAMSPLSEKPYASPASRPLPTHVVLKIKRHGDGTVERFKARIVAGGNFQTYGSDYTDTYAPVVDFALVRLFLCVAMNRGMYVSQADVKTAFLNGELDEDVWVLSPKGIPGHSPRRYKLRKALRRADSSSTPNKDSFILVYVDDLLILSPTAAIQASTLKSLHALYDMREMGRVDTFLGVHMNWDDRGRWLHMSQSRYTLSMLKRFGMHKSKPAVTPMIEAFFSGLDAEKDKTAVDAELYRSIVGSLLYLALRSRPDIMVAVSILARFNQSPTAYCHRGAKRVLRYLCGCPDVGVLMRAGRLDVNCYVDSDYAGNTVDRKSISGFFIKIDKAPCIWGYKKQASVALSTCEAEYHAMTVAAKEVIWLRRVLAEIGCGISSASVLRSDNQSAITWAEGERFPLSRAKHIDVRVHFIRDMVMRRDINVCYVPTNVNDADMLTKPVGPTTLEEARRRIGILSISDSSSFEEE